MQEIKKYIEENKDNVEYINEYLYREILSSEFIEKHKTKLAEKIYDMSFELEDINNGHNYEECIEIINDIYKNICIFIEQIENYGRIIDYKLLSI